MKGYGKWDYNYAIMQVIKFEYELFFFVGIEYELVGNLHSSKWYFDYVWQ